MVGSATTPATPQDVIRALLREREDFPNLRALAEVSTPTYQTLWRWQEGQFGNITQDKLADFLVELKREPEKYGVRPSAAWRKKNEGRPGATAAPAYLQQFIEQQTEALAEINAKLDELLAAKRKSPRLQGS